MSNDQDRNEKGASWPLFLIGALITTGFLSVAAWNVELPYLAYSPGPVSDAADSVVAEEDVAVYPPTGELLMLTALHQDVNVFEAFIAGADPTIDLIRKQAVRREGETDQEYRSRVLQQMEDSNYVSIVVTLDYLGYDKSVVVTEVLEDVPASDHIEPGDAVVSFSGEKVTTYEDLLAALEGHEAGDTVDMSIERDGNLVELTIELAEREGEPGEPMIGITLQELIDPPLPVEIQAGDVGGPSAGLMHTLAIIDSLTEGELTNGRVIAGTGTIALDGSVGGVGALRQKVPAAEAAGAELMIVPRSNYETALTAERDTIEIVPVATLQEAIDFLEGLEPA